MVNRNNQFLEEYKRLDKLLRDMYQSEKGVTAYIDHMKSVAPCESKGIPGWDDDFRRLNALRKLRNYLVHECGTMEQALCSQDDITLINDFYRRIVQIKDPIAMYTYRRKTSRRGTVTERENYMGFSELGMQENRSKFDSCVGKILVCVMILVACAMLVWIMGNLLQ